MNYMKEIVMKNKIIAAIYLTAGIWISFLTNYKIKYFQKIIDDFTGDILTNKSILIYGAILVIFYLGNYLDEYPGKKLEHGIYLDFKLLSLKKVSKIDYLDYQSLGTGKLTQNIENGANAGKSILFDFWLRLLRQLAPTICFSIFFIWRINKTVTYVILIGYVIVFIITNLLLKVLYQIKEKILNNEEKLNHYLVRGFMEMVVFRLERRFLSEIYKASKARDEIVNSKVKMNLIHEAFFTIFALLVAMLNVGVLLYAWHSKTLTVGSAIALISLIENAYTPIAIFNVLFVQYKLNKETYKRFEAFLNLKDDPQLDRGMYLHNLSGEIQIENLGFEYGNKNIFRNLNLEIRPGEKVAFVGASGSGKTTLIKIIIGLLKYKRGNVKLDGEEISNLGLNHLYENLSYISQDTPVFDGSVKENIVFDQQTEDSLVKEALEKVQLYPTIKKMKAGINTMVGEKGITLSGGERQRLALARLWFQKNNLVILDEATSAMDNLTEEAVMNEVVHLLSGKTVLAIAHRLSSIKGFDRIVVFRDGEIAGQGTFLDLMENNTYFAELYKSSALS